MTPSIGKLCLGPYFEQGVLERQDVLDKHKSVKTRFGEEAVPS